MPDFKLTWRFVGNDGSEWTEQWYVGNASNPTSAASPLPALLAARLSLLHPLNLVRSITAADVLVKRSTSQVILNLRGTGDRGTDNGPAPRDHAIVIGFVGATGSKRKLWLRGWKIGDARMDPTSGLQGIDPAFGIKLTGWYATLKDAGYGIRKLTPVVNEANEIAAIQNIDAVTKPGFSLLTLDKALNVNDGQRVVISKANRKDTPALNGRWTVIKVAGAIVTIPYIPPRGLNVTADIGRMKKEQYQPVDIIDPARAAVDHFGAHDTKVPLSHSRGARRAGRIRQLA